MTVNYHCDILMVQTKGLKSLKGRNSPDLLGSRVSDKNVCNTETAENILKKFFISNEEPKLRVFVFGKVFQASPMFDINVRSLY